MLPSSLLASLAKTAARNNIRDVFGSALTSSHQAMNNVIFPISISGCSNLSTSKSLIVGVRRNVSTTPVFKSSSKDGSGSGNSGGGDGKSKEEIISRWMKWNTSKTFKYKPNMDLIDNIGKEGSTSPLDQFRDLVPREKRDTETVGRSWTVKELRRKSYEDLHKLWYVLYKERNMLLTEANLARRHGYYMIQPERRLKVKKSMGAIKHVLGERKRKKIAEHRQYLAEVERLGGLVGKVDLHDNEMEESMHNEAKSLDNKEP
mmetsp:Transcript_29055/g.58148  ORF Transcript_29055/g.58148 Transcript_29055/m.58148 type:complete len:261 (+) Transcript_29055:191-973(+)